MSALFGLPARLAADRFRRAQVAVRVLAALFSLGCGLTLAYEVGIAL